MTLVALMPALALGTAPHYEEGQVWAYKTRPNEGESTRLIDKVEDDPKLGRIFHISISRVQLKSGPAVMATELSHLPVFIQTLRLSCTKLKARSKPNPMYLPGYRVWREAFEAGHAGIYTISISDILDLTEKMLQKQATAT